MVFSTKTILESKKLASANDNTINKNNEFIFENYLQYILDESNNFTVHLLDESITYSLNELFSLKEFIKKFVTETINHILEGFVKIVEKLWTEFEVFFVNNFINNSITLTNLKSKLLNYNNDLDLNIFPITYYDFTNLDLGNSYTSFRNEIDTELKHFRDDLFRLSNINNYEELVSDLTETIELSSHDKDSIDQLRGSILGYLNPVSEDNFRAELFNYFTNGGKPVEKFSFSNNEIRNIAKYYYNYKTTLFKTKREKINMQSDARAAQKEIKKENLRDNIRINNSNDCTNMFSTIVKNRTSYIQEICNLYIIVFGVKMEVLSKQHKLYKQILMKVVDDIVRGDK